MINIIQGNQGDRDSLKQEKRLMGPAVWNLEYKQTVTESCYDKNKCEIFEPEY